MRKQKIYLETTIFNRYFDYDRDYHLETLKLFEEITLGKFEAYTSAYVIEELLKAPEPKRGLMLSLLEKFNVAIFEATDEISYLADMYAKEGIIPEKYKYDGLHIAAASINEMDFIISLNFQHINKLKTKTCTELINKLHGYRSVYICSPMEVIESDE